ncbi:mitochondrial substrate carrier family protein [Klebsormidium nitens]|uniref:Mitochondrial substrate carrier family protein n=1 Tax=Klebsormidium nitens TaxID=105231 RepID=A0A1Y1HUY3_KLENI|nr:mitochondrial substrate carrier family protein [Klebsormidium nitens]|eukprot:GAQ82434.1 mitochondrial substrate carrier family protein [Klebsormidium nitens]
MIAGSVAGMVEHMAMFPVDTIKTRMQALGPMGSSGVRAPPHSTIAKAVSSIMRREGASGLYRGIGAMGLGAGPAHAVYFAVYEAAKSKLGGNRKGHHPLAHGMAGAIATVASDAVLTPMDVVKQRLQLRDSPYRGVADCVRRILKEEGVRAFYRSYPTTLVMNVPFTAVHFATYEAVKRMLGQSAGEDRLLTHVIAGGAAGALASGVTTPLDVVKTRLQTQGVTCRQYKSSNVFKTMKLIVREEGPRALWRGWRPRIMFHTPAAAICWSTYEAMKGVLTKIDAKIDHVGDGVR